MKKRYNRIVFPGRFQPVHNGHISVIKWILEHTDEMIIVVGSAQKSHTMDNPFTAGERILMLKHAMRDAGIDLSRIYIVPVPDIEYNSLWVSYLKTLVPPFEAGASRNPLVIRLFKEVGLEVVVPPPYMRERYSGRHIRKLMYEGGDWRKLVPPVVAELITRFKGIDRMIEASLSDEIDAES